MLKQYHEESIKAKFTTSQEEKNKCNSINEEYYLCIDTYPRLFRLLYIITYSIYMQD